jgi:transglutaminase-like putative cysteine protease
MRHGSDERIAVTSALATMLATLTLSPLVQGSAWVFVAAITVIAAMVTGIVFRQLVRWWPAVAGAQLLVVLVTLTILFARSRVVEGAGAITLLSDLVNAGLQVTREQAPPVEATQGIILLLAGSAGLVAVLVDLLAATLRQPALAGLPLLAVYCVPAALLDGGLPWFYFLLAAGGFLVLLTADSGDRVRSWGRVLASSGGGHRPADGGMARGGRRVGVAAALMAVVVPTLVPGLGNQIIGGGGDGDAKNGKGRTITRVNPILDLRKDLASPDDTPLLTYTTDVKNPSPLRIVTSDVFDGKTWAPGTQPIPRSQKARSGLPSPPGLSSDVATTTHTTTIQVGRRLSETYLPLPYPSTSIQVPGEWLYDADTLNVIGDGITTRGLTYTARHLEVEPTAAQLAGAGAPPPGLSAKYENLPNDLSPEIEQIAKSVARSGTNYEKAVRLQRWFRSDGGFQYTLDAPPTDGDASGSDAILAFLKDKHGYCVHFAASMAVMARTLGIPARVAVGFLPGQPQPDGSIVISAHDAHAWPELYFEGVGWVRFEPTPRGGLTVPPEWSVPPAGLLPEDDETTSAPADTSAATGGESAAPRAPKRLDDEKPATAAPSEGSSMPWRPLLVVLLLLSTLAGPRVAASVASRRRWRRAVTTADLAEAAWADLRLQLSDLGISWVASWTPRAAERRLRSDFALGSGSDAALARLALEIENARYAPPDEDLGRSMETRQADVAAVIAAVATGLSDRTRWRARFWPRSGVDTLAGLGSWINVATERAGRQASALGSQARGRVGRPGSGPGSGSGPSGSGPSSSGPSSSGPSSSGPSASGPSASGPAAGGSRPEDYAKDSVS